MLPPSKLKLLCRVTSQVLTLMNTERNVRIGIGARARLCWRRAGQGSNIIRASEYLFCVPSWPRITLFLSHFCPSTVTLLFFVFIRKQQDILFVLLSHRLLSQAHTHYIRPELFCIIYAFAFFHCFSFASPHPPTTVSHFPLRSSFHTDSSSLCNTCSSVVTSVLGIND
jgi:hypothetical protein